MVRFCILTMSFFCILTSYGQDNVLCHKYYISVYEDDVRDTTYSQCLESGFGYDCAALNISFPKYPIDSILLNYLSFNVTDLEIHDIITRTFPKEINKYPHLLNLDVYFKKVCDSKSVNISNLNNLVHFGFHSKTNDIPKDVFYLKSLKSLGVTSNRNLKVEIPIDNISLLEEFYTNAKMSKENLTEILKLKTLRKITFDNVKKVKEYYSLLRGIQEIEIFGKLSEDEQKRLKELLPQAVYEETPATK